MSKKQRIVVYVCLTILVLMLVFPPFRRTGSGIYETHAFFTSCRAHDRYIALDIYRLAMQMLMLGLTGAGVFMAVRDKK